MTDSVHTFNKTWSLLAKELRFMKTDALLIFIRTPELGKVKQD
jgi:hypothetical protein